MKRWHRGFADDQRQTTDLMTWVKICGITNLGDALAAVEAGADALGFVFYDKSPRKVDVAMVREMIDELPGKVEKVGVFVDTSSERMWEIVSQAGLTAIQLHGESAWDYVHRFELDADRSFGAAKIIPAIPGNSLKEGCFISNRCREQGFALLLDAQTNGKTGGTGTTFDWAATREMVQMVSLQIPVIVAGGLTPLNVGEAIKMFRPFGVDVSSGVEARPGKKDPEKIRAFVQAARQADKIF
jgi:phosphoribosylanthranilate isomerase